MTAQEIIDRWTGLSVRDLPALPLDRSDGLTAEDALHDLLLMIKAYERLHTKHKELSAKYRALLDDVTGLNAELEDIRAAHDVILGKFKYQEKNCITNHIMKAPRRQRGF